MSIRYEWNPSEYARNSEPHTRAAEELLARLDLKPDDVVIDIGCGDGRHTAAIASRVPLGKVLGVDLSAEMIRFASETFPRRRYPNLRFEVGDATALRFVSEFSVVFSNLALHWVADHGPLLEGLIRALRPQGFLCMQMSEKGNYAVVLAACDGLTQDRLWRSYFQDFSLKLAQYDAHEYRTLLKQAGFIADEVKMIEREIVYPNRQSFVGFWRNVAHPYTSRLPPQHRDLFLDQVADRYAERHPPDANGQLLVRARRLFVVAHRPAAA